MLAIISYLFIGKQYFHEKESVKPFVGNIENKSIKDGKQAELLADLKAKNGFNVHRYSIHKIDFVFSLK